jgi:hypothetical protein
MCGRAAKLGMSILDGDLKWLNQTNYGDSSSYGDLTKHGDLGLNPPRRFNAPVVFFFLITRVPRGFFPPGVILYQVWRSTGSTTYGDRDGETLWERSPAQLTGFKDKYPEVCV